MSEPTAASYGAWTSPITSDLIVASTITLDAPTIVGSDIYWSEQRPSEGGRVVLVRRSPDGVATDLIPQPFNARTRVHEYGGGAVLIDTNGTVYFSNFADQYLYRIRPGGQPELIANEPGMRYADAIVDRDRNRLICV